MYKISKWEETNFSDIISINPRESLQKGTIAKKVGMANVREHTKSIVNYEYEEYKSGPKFRQGDTLFARITPCLENGKISKVTILKEEEIGFGSTEFIIMRAKPNITDSDFVYYLSKWDGVRETAIKSMTGTSGRQRVQNAVFDELKILLPPLTEQKAIANLLSSLDDKIENNNAIIANLEEQAQTIFKSWFVDFEPFQDDEFKDSEMGRIPKEYMIQNLETISSIQTGFAFKSKDYQIEGTKVIRTLNIKDNFLDGSEYVYLPNFFYANKKYMKQRLQQFDTLLVMVGATIGKTGMVLSKDVPSLQNQNMWRFRPLDGKCSPIFVHYVVKLVNSMVTGWVSGSARGFYRKDIFSKQKVVVPNEKWMGKFNQITIKLFELIENLKKQNIKLVEIRDTLLPKLMSGEIRVGEVVTEE